MGESYCRHRRCAVGIVDSKSDVTSRRTFCQPRVLPRWRRRRFSAAKGKAPWRYEGRQMEIKRIGSQPSSKGPADWFTGTVRVDPLFEAPAPARIRGASVTFEPGART